MDIAVDLKICRRSRLRDNLTTGICRRLRRLICSLAPARKSLLPTSKQVATNDQTGNSSEAWASSADWLLAAVRILRAARDAALDNPVNAGAPLRDGETVGPSEKMLRGFALECLFKALWVKRGNLLASNGRLQKIPNVGNHNLLQLAQKLNFKCEPIEQDLLKRLSIFMRSVGRYPIPTDWHETMIQKTFDGGEGPPTYWQSPRDDDAYNSIVMRLKAEHGT